MLAHTLACIDNTVLTLAAPRQQPTTSVSLAFNARAYRQYRPLMRYHKATEEFTAGYLPLTFNTVWLCDECGRLLFPAWERNLKCTNSSP